MHAAAREEPVPGHAIAAVDGDRAPAWIRRSGRDADRVAVEDLATDLGRELRKAYDLGK